MSRHAGLHLKLAAVFILGSLIAACAPGNTDPRVGDVKVRKHIVKTCVGGDLVFRVSNMEGRVLTVDKDSQECAP